MKLDVPFHVQNGPLTCGANNLRMIFEYFGLKKSESEICTDLSYVEGKSLFTIELAILAKKFDYCVEFYSTELGLSLEVQNTDFFAKSANQTVDSVNELFAQAEKLGVKIEKKSKSLDYIKQCVVEKKGVILILDWSIVRGENGSFLGHFVPVVGFDDEFIYVHDGGQAKGHQSFLPILIDVFEKARKSKGTDEDLLIIYPKN